MNKHLAAAAVLMAATALLHLIAGEIDPHCPLLARAVAPTDAPYISILWHGVSAMLVLSTAALALAASDAARHAAAAWIATLWSLALGALFVGYGWAYLGSPFVLPQWTLLWAVAGLAGWGLWPRGLNGR